MAGLACGNIDDDNDFYGMAPLSSIAFVKLKDAKNMIFMASSGVLYVIRKMIYLQA